MKEISRKCLIFPGCSPIIKRKERLKNRVKKKMISVENSGRSKLEEIATR